MQAMAANLYINYASLLIKPTLWQWWLWSLQDLALQNIECISGNLISEQFRGQTREIWQLVRQI